MNTEKKSKSICLTIGEKELKELKSFQEKHGFLSTSETLRHILRTTKSEVVTSTTGGAAMITDPVTVTPTEAKRELKDEKAKSN